MRRAAFVAALALAALGAAPARAAGPDGAYGRLDGDLELRAEAGAAFAAGGPALAAGAAALYLGSAGVYAHYTDALGSGAPVVGRSIAAGVHVQPLFLARYGTDNERGPAYLDLLVDSAGFEIGAFWDAPRGRALLPSPGIEIALTLGVPLLPVPRATGPFLGVRGALRWRAVDLGGSDAGVIDRGGVLSLVFGWHHVVRAHLVDAGDRLGR